MKSIMIRQEKDYSNTTSILAITLVGLSDKSLWQELLHGIEHSFYQTWDYCNAISQSQDHEIELLKICDSANGIIIIFSKRSKIPGYFDIYSPYGFGGIISWGNDLENIYSGLSNWLKCNNVVTAFLMAHPVFTSSNDKHLESHRSAFVIDLSKSIDELWENLGDGHKYEIKKITKKSAFILTDDKQAIFNKLPLLYTETITRVGAGSPYYFSTSTLQDLTFNESSLVLGAMIDDEIKAVIMISYTKECAEYFLNASSEDGRIMTRSLLWDAIKKLKFLGVKKFNVGGGAIEGDQLEHFKKRMGGYKVPISVYKKTINQEMYNKLCSTFCIGDVDTSYFPPYWKNKERGDGIL